MRGRRNEPIIIHCDRCSQDYAWWSVHEASNICTPCRRRQYEKDKWAEIKANKHRICPDCSTAVLEHRRQVCAECLDLRERARQQRNNERAKQRDPETRRAESRRYILRKYGLTPESYQQMLDAQGGVCAICQGTQPWGNLAVDHDHSCCPGYGSCGQCVRGLLCWDCNRHKLAWFEKHRDRVLAYVEKAA